MKKAWVFYQHTSAFFCIQFFLKNKLTHEIIVGEFV